MLRPDWEWLLYLSQYAYLPEAGWLAGSQHLPADVPDFAWVGREALRHRVAPTVLAALERLDLLKRLPSDVLEALRADDERSRHRWHVQARELEVLVAACRSARLTTGVLRGPAVSRLYRVPHWRKFQDFDLLIRLEDAGLMDYVLCDQGYVQAVLDDAKRISPVDRETLDRQWEEKRLHPYLKYFPGDESQVFIVEPHFRLVPSYEPHQFPIEPLVEAIARGSQLSPELAVPTLPVEEFSLELALHMYTHATWLPSVRCGNDCLLYRWLDLAVLTHQLRRSISWTHLADLVARWQLERPAAYAFPPLGPLYGVELPDNEVLVPPDWQARTRGIWYFGRHGRYGQVAELSQDLISRVFDPMTEPSLHLLEHS